MNPISEKRQLGIRQRSIRSKFMRATELVFVLAMGTALVITLPAAAQAQTLEWDGAGATANGTVEGGSGTWDATTENWTSDGGTANEEWTDDAKAVFGGTAGTVTVDGTQDVQNITFDVDGYTVTGGTLNYTNTDPDPVTDPITDTDRGIMVRTGTATIASDIVSTTGLTKAGSGTLVLSGSNSISGTLRVQGGHLVATAPDALTGISELILQDSLELADDDRTLTTVTADLGGATVNVTQFAIQGYGATAVSNGTVNFSNLAQIGNAVVDTVLTGTGNVEALVGGSATMNQINTYTGSTNIGGSNEIIVSDTGAIRSSTDITNAGQLQVNGAAGDGLADDAVIQNTGTFTLTGSDETVGAILGTGNVALNDNTLMLNEDSEIDGVISGSGDLVFQGDGYLALGGNNTMTGSLYNTGGGNIDNRGEFVGDIHNVDGHLANGSWIDGTIENSGSFTNNNVVNGDLINKAGGTVTNGAWIFGHVTNELGATFNEQGNSGSYGQGVTNNGTFNINGTAFGLTGGTFENNNILNNNSGGAIVFTVGTGGSLVNNGTINGGTGGITLNGDAFTIGTGSTLNNVTIDVDNLTADINYDLSGTTGYNFTNNATAAVVADADFGGGDLTNTDRLDVSGGDLTGVGELHNTGEVNIGDGTARVLEASSVTNEGTINVNDGSTLRGTGNTTNNSGVVNVDGGGTLEEVTGDYNNLAGGTVNFNGTDPKTFDVQTGVITNAGDLNFNGGVTTVNSAGGALDNSGTITIDTGARMDASGDTILNTGSATLSVADGAGANFDDLNNTSAGTGATLGTAGVRVADDGAIDAETISNTGGGTMVNAGTLTTRATGGAGLTNGDGSTLISTGVIDVSASVSGNAFANAGTAQIEGTLTGNMSNTGRFEATGDLNHTGSIINNGAGIFAVTGGTVTSSRDFTNVSPGTGNTADTAAVQVAAGTELSVYSFSNLPGGTVNIAGTLTTTDPNEDLPVSNRGTMTVESTGVVNGGVYTDGTFTSRGQVNGDLTNWGTATISGGVDGNVTNRNLAQLNIDGDLVMDGDLVNNDFARVAVTAGTVTGIGLLSNASPRAGTGAGEAGFEIVAGAAVNADQVWNFEDATMLVAGMLNSTSAINNAGTLISTGTLSGGLNNVGSATVRNTLLGDVENTLSGLMTIDGDLTMNGDMRNYADAEVDVAAGTVTGLLALTNMGTGSGTGADAAGFEIDAGATVNAESVLNLQTGTMFIAGALNASDIIYNEAIFTSVGAITGEFQNDGTATIRNQLLGDIQNTNGAQLIVDGDLLAGGLLLNDAGGLVDIDAGTVTGVTTLRNASVGEGTAAGQAGLEIDDGAVVTAEIVTNSGSMYIAGDLNSDTTIVNTGVLNSVGALSGDLTNTLVANLEGTLDGDLTNDGAYVQTTGDLSETGQVANINGSQMQLATGSTFSFEALENDETSLLNLNNGTLDGDVNNTGIVYYSGTITGALVNDGLAEMRNGATDDAIRIGGGLSGVGTYGYDLDLTLGDASADLFAVEGATTGALNLEFNQLTSETHLMEDALLVFDVDDGAANDFSFTATGLDPDGSPVSLFAGQRSSNGDIFVQAGASLTLGALLGGMSQIEGLANLQAGSLAPHVTNCGGAGGWARTIGGEAVTEASTENSGQHGVLDITTDYQGVQVGADLGCTTTAGGWDLSYSILAGSNSGSSTQDLTRDGSYVDSTGLDFDQVYAGFYGSAAAGSVTMDLMLSYGQTDYDISNGAIALGLSDTEFSTETIKLTGSITNDLPLNSRGLSLVQHAGFSASSTSIDDLAFDAGQTLESDDFTSTSGFAGVALKNAFTSGNGDTVLNTFACVTYYGALSSDQNAALVEASGIESGISTTGVGEFGEVSIGVDFTRKLSGNRTFNTALRADGRTAGDVEGYNVGLQVGFQF